jgi:hypothetical protein
VTFHLSDYEARTQLRRLDGKPLTLPKRGCLAVYTHPSTKQSRMVRVFNNSDTAVGAKWGVMDDAPGSFYLAGPMRGYPLFNFPAFLMAARILEARGFTIMSPAEKDMESGFDPSRSAEEQKFDIGAAFRWDFKAVCDTHGIILLPGWENSTGAKAERLVAQLCEREVYLLDVNHKLTEAPPMDYHLSWTEQAQILPAPAPAPRLPTNEELPFP